MTGIQSEITRKFAKKRSFTAPVKKFQFVRHTPQANKPFDVKSTYLVCQAPFVSWFGFLTGIQSEYVSQKFFSFLFNLHRIFRKVSSSSHYIQSFYRTSRLFDPLIFWFGFLTGIQSDITRKFTKKRSCWYPGTNEAGRKSIKVK